LHVPAENRRITANCSHGASSPPWARWKSRAPGICVQQALVGQQAPFDDGREQIKVLAGLEVTTKVVERTAEAVGQDIALRQRHDGTGVPVVKKETQGRKGKADGQPAHTREAKLGCVFTQIKWDQGGFASATRTPRPMSALSKPPRSLAGLYLEAWNSGWSRAAKTVVIGDGAEWIRNLVETHFPGAIQIVDLYHARQHLWTVARAL
jgi:hypothetical protein